MTKLKQFSKEFGVLYSRKNNPQIRGVQCLISCEEAPEGFGAKVSFTVLEKAKQKHGFPSMTG